MDELIERLRARAEASGGDKLLEEAAAALEAAREDAERWRWLMAAAKEHTRWSIFDAAIDQARGKGVADES